MEKQADRGLPDLKPNRLVTNMVIGAQAKHALSRTLSANSIATAERMLDALEHEYASMAPL